MSNGSGVRPGRTPIVAVTDTAVGNEDLERALAAEVGATYNSCGDGLDLPTCLADADVVFTNFAPLGRAELDLVASGSVVIRYGVGVDNVDLAAAADLGVQVANIPDYGANVVADHAALLAGMLVRRIPRFDRAMHEGREPDAAEFGEVRSLESLTVGLVGAGRIAQLTAARMQAFGLRVIAADPFADEEDLAARGISLTDLDELLRSSDLISLHAPLTSETQHLLDDAAFAVMREGVFIVNTARGGLIDTAALVRALRSGRVAGAALDVTDPEPLPADSALRTLDNVILTPHVAFYSTESMSRLQSLAVEEAARALRGEPLRSPVPLPTSSAGASTSTQRDSTTADAEGRARA
jgi:D-3-phosphoglycerate dehydrogenase / 2-oxoglutarate reductase